MRQGPTIIKAHVAHIPIPPMNEDIRQRVYNLALTWPRRFPYPKRVESFSLETTSEHYTGQGKLILQTMPGEPAFYLHENMVSLLRIISPPNSRIEKIEDPSASDIEHKLVKCWMGVEVDDPWTIWLSYTAMPEGHNLNAVVFVQHMAPTLMIIRSRMLREPIEARLISTMLGQGMNHADIFWVFHALLGESFRDFITNPASSSALSLTFRFNVTQISDGEFLPKIHDAALWPQIIPIAAARLFEFEFIHIHVPSAFELGVIMQHTQEHIFCIFRSIDMNHLIVVTAEKPNPKLANLLPYSNAVRVIWHFILN